MTNALQWFPFSMCELKWSISNNILFSCQPKQLVCSQQLLQNFHVCVYHDSRSMQIQMNLWGWSNCFLWGNPSFIYGHAFLGSLTGTPPLFMTLFHLGPWYRNPSFICGHTSFGGPWYRNPSLVDMLPLGSLIQGTPLSFVDMLPLGVPDTGTPLS